MKKYLYLTKQQYVRPWIEGGPIPISLASKFIGDARRGTQTPDENQFHRSNVDLTSLSPLIQIGTVVDLTIIGAKINGVPQPDIVNATYGSEDGLVVCLANSLSRSIGERLGKKACVEIQDVAALKTCIDEQLGTDGIMRECQYTDGHERDTFLKSRADDWQDEFRIYWPIVINNAEVSIPAGLAKEMIFDPPLVPMQVEPLPERTARVEFSAHELESIKALVIGYIRARQRPASRPEICSVVLAHLHFNYDRTNRVLNQLANAGLIEDTTCVVHHGHVQLTPAGKTCVPRIQIEAPDPI